MLTKANVVESAAYLKGKLPFVPQDREVVSYSDVTKAKQRRLKGEILPDPAMGGHVLGDILRKACAVNPRDRYQSPQEMYEELEKLLQSYDQNQKDQETAKVSEKRRDRLAQIESSKG